MRSSATSYACASAAALLCACAAAQEPFPKFEDIPKELLMPQNAAITVSPDGGYLADGKPRYLFGAQTSATNIAGDLAATPGYPAAFKWIYEEPLSYANAQRLGIDILSYFSSSDWIKRSYPGTKRWHQPNPKNGALAMEFLSSGLPLQVDYTCAEWSHGQLAKDKELKSQLPPEALTVDDRHWVPYNIFHPEGRKVYKAMWESGVEEAMAAGVKPLLYELFNEPAYDDPSPYNRALFAKDLQAKYKTPEAMNKLWRTSYPSFEAASRFKLETESPGLFVDWTKFCENGMLELAKYGRSVIRAKVPGANACYQIMGAESYRCISGSKINIYAISSVMDQISTATSGGLTISSSFEAPPPSSVEAPSNANGVGEGMLERHFFRCVADGKPIFNPECYAAATRNGNANVEWMDMLRGSNATFMFVWCKRAWDWKPARDEDGGRRCAEKFPFLLLNPYANPTDSLAGFMDAKKEIFRFAGFFLPRDRGLPRETAVLISYPTERYATPTGGVAKNDVRAYVAGLEFAHYPLEAIMEEQLPSGRLAAKKFKAVVAVGVSNTMPSTLPALERFVADGGVLIAAREFMSMDEYGNPLRSKLFAGLEAKDAEARGLSEIKLELERPAGLEGRIMGRSMKHMEASKDWEAAGSDGKEPSVLRKAFGKGWVYAVNPTVPDYAAAAIAGAILNKHGVKPSLEIFRVPQGDMALNMEVHMARREGLAVAFVLNFDKYPKLSEVKLPDGFACAASLLDNKLLPVRNGRALFMSGSNKRAVLGFGSKADLEKRFGPLAPADEKAIERDFAEAEDSHSKELERRKTASIRFDVDRSLTTPIDLRPFANSSFVDNIPGDGEGGWTDQGKENSLTGTPWEVVDLLGVPCDFIRFDQNADKTCIVLKSKSMTAKKPQEVKGIPVNAKVRTLFFFHTGAWIDERGPEPALTYRVEYVSGRSVDIPVLAGKDIGDWWIPKSTSLKVAWQNIERRGFYAMDWKNPFPQEEIKAIDILSHDTKTIPIVIGITMERLSESAKELKFLPLKAAAWGNCSLKIEGGAASVSISEKSLPWAGLEFKCPEAFEIPQERIKGSSFKFEINGGLDAFGNEHGGQRLQIWLKTNGENEPQKIQIDAPDSDPSTFETRAIPLDRLLGSKSSACQVRGAAFQFVNASVAGFQIRNLRIELK